MSGGEDFDPPIDLERSRVKVPLAVTVAAVLLSAVASASVTWGVYSQRIANLEDEARTVVPLVRSHETQLAVIGAQYSEINRRLGVIDAKLDQDRP